MSLSEIMGEPIAFVVAVEVRSAHSICRIDKISIPLLSDRINRMLLRRYVEEDLWATEEELVGIFGPFSVGDWAVAMSPAESAYNREISRLLYRANESDGVEKEIYAKQIIQKADEYFLKYAFMNKYVAPLILFAKARAPVSSWEVFRRGFNLGDVR